MSDTGVEFRWNVPSDMIDLDRVAAVYVAARLSQAKSKRSIPWTYWVVIPFCVAVLALLVSPWLLIWGAAAVLLPTVGARWWNRSAARRLATRLRKIPAASEAYCFIASEAGTEAMSESGSGHLAWSRYSEVLGIDDQTVLVADDGLMRILPTKALTSQPTGLGPEDAVAAIREWLTVPTAS